MLAHPGDWLLIRSHSDGGHIRRAQILATAAAGGPPFTVKWTEDDHESTIFPGSDAQVVSAADEQAIEQNWSTPGSAVPRS
jgi:hypothetical protein